MAAVLLFNIYIFWLQFSASCYLFNVARLANGTDGCSHSDWNFASVHIHMYNKDELQTVTVYQHINKSLIFFFFEREIALVLLQTKRFWLEKYSIDLVCNILFVQSNF